MNENARDTRQVKPPEDRVLAALLRMALEHCARPDGTLDSYMHAPGEMPKLCASLAEAGFIRVDGDTGDRIRATPPAQAVHFLASMKENVSERS